MKISIVGGRGFIGSNLVDPILNNTDKKVVIETVDRKTETVHPATKIICVDLLNKEFASSMFYTIPPDIIIDTIGTKGYNTNFDQILRIPLVTASICDMMISNSFKGRFVYISSTKAADPSFVGDSYRISEGMLKDTCKRLGARLSIVRVPLVYGVREGTNDMINRIIESILLGEEVVTIHKESSVDLLHIKDLVNAVITLLKSSNEVFENMYTLSGSVLTVEKLSSVLKSTIGYGSFIFNDTVLAHHTKVNDTHTREALKLKRILFNKKVATELVNNRKDILVKKGYMETEVEV